MSAGEGGSREECDRILPAIYSDNHVALMPGEKRSIRTEPEDVDTHGEGPRIAVDGFNIGDVIDKSLAPR